METGLPLVSYNLAFILDNHIELAKEISSRVKIFDYFDAYLKYGYYPFYRDNADQYLFRLEQVINTILDVDLPHMVEINAVNIFKMKSYSTTLPRRCPSNPISANWQPVLKSTETHSAATFTICMKPALLLLLLDAGKSYSLLSKPEKKYICKTPTCFMPSMLKKPTKARSGKCSFSTS